MRLRFGEHTFDPESGELWRNGKSAPLSVPARELLRLLVERRPAPLSREMLRAALWPDTPAPEGTLAALVLELRGILEGKGDAETIRRTTDPAGYAFVAPAAEDRRPIAGDRGFRYRLLWDEREIALPEGESVIGRDYGVDVLIEDPKVSRRHATIAIAGGRALLSDLSSRNGTFCNDRRIDAPVELADGDRIQVGRVHLVFRMLPLVSD